MIGPVSPARCSDIDVPQRLAAQVVGRHLQRLAGCEHYPGFAIDISPNLPATFTNKNEHYEFHN